MTNAMHTRYNSINYQAVEHLLSEGAPTFAIGNSKVQLRTEPRRKLSCDLTTPDGLTWSFRPHTLADLATLIANAIVATAEGELPIYA